MKKTLSIIIILLILTVIGGGIVCADNEEALDEAEIKELMAEILDSADEISSSEPNVTSATQLLAAMPEREDKPSIAVYNISDKTGQRKELGASVVTQGATDMMITALQRSRQFIVIDRVNFNDFMNEQNLQAQDRLSFGKGPELGEMTGADYVLGGAITEYQVDKKTRGWGISIGGIGGTQKYALATTAIDLRLTDTTTGEVVWAESLKGEIEGEKVGVQSFSFLGDNVVEFETGQGKQEVINLVVRTLLEEAVFKLYERDVI